MLYSSLSPNATLNWVWRRGSSLISFLCVQSCAVSSVPFPCLRAFLVFWLISIASQFSPFGNCSTVLYFLHYYALARYFGPNYSGLDDLPPFRKSHNIDIASTEENIHCITYFHYHRNGLDKVGCSISLCNFPPM